MTNVLNFRDNPDHDPRRKADELYAAWLTGRAKQIDPASTAKVDDEIAHDRDVEEFAMKIAAQPAREAHMILRKLEILELTLANSVSDQDERPEFMMLAGIRADLISLDRRT